MGSSLYLAERYMPDDGSRPLAGLVAHPGQLGPGAALMWALHAARDSTVLILLQADGMDLALDALRRAGFPADRITEVEAITPRATGLPSPAPGPALEHGPGTPNAPASRAKMRALPDAVGAEHRTESTPSAEPRRSP